MKPLIKFRYVYGFLILLILFSGFYIADVNGFFPDKISDKPLITSDFNSDDLDEIAGKGLGDPRGNHTIREIIVSYNLTKEEFYDTLAIPYDYPDTATVIDLIKDGIVTSKQVQAYMTPITTDFGK